MSQRGFSMLEVLVVLGVVSVLSAMLVPSSQENVSLERVIGNAKLLSQKLVDLSVEARSSGRTFKLDCDPAGIRVTAYKDVQSRLYNDSNTATSDSSKIISAYANVALLNLGSSTRLSGLCAVSTRIFITREGHFFSATSAGIPNLELRSGSYRARLDVSATGVSTIYAGTSGGPLNEM